MPQRGERAQGCRQQACKAAARGGGAREARGGTDDLIRRASGLARNKRNLILVKAKKPGQDRRVDLPTMGLETVQLAAEHGFSGIAIEAGHSLLVDKERAIAAADAANLFIVGI